MKRKIIVLKNLAFCILMASMLIVVAIRCTEENDQPEADVREDLDLATNASLSESLSEEDISFSYLAADGVSPDGGKVMNDHLRCAVVTRNKEAHTIVIDFGDGCIGPYGRERSGKIIITYGGAFNDHLANRVITFEDYFVNHRQITGIIELRNLNRNDEGFLTATRKLIDYTIHFPNGENYVANGSITREWIEGEGDGNPRTNVIRITGSYEGVSSRGGFHTIDILEPVIASFPCRAQGGFLRIAGIREIRITRHTAQRIRTVYFGDGTCDNEITVVINGRTFTITEE